MPPTLGARWGAAGAFAIECADAEIVRKATAIFAGWSDVALPERRTWRVERAADVAGGAGGAWEIQASDSSEPVREATRERVLIRIEAAAQQAFLDAHAAEIPFHAALLSADGVGGVAVVGAHLAGKSTLACALWQRGWRLLADDLMVVDPATLRTWPSPRRAHLRVASESFFDADLVPGLAATPAYTRFANVHVFRQGDVDATSAPVPVDLRLVIFLGRSGRPAAPPARLTRIEPAHALLALLPFSLRVAEHGLGYGLQAMRRLADRVPAFDLARGPLDHMVHAVIDVQRRGMGLTRPADSRAT